MTPDLDYHRRGVRLHINEETVEVRLALWEKVLGLMGDIRVARSEVSDVRLIDDPVRDAMGAGLKAGLRLPWLCYVCRSIKLDRAWVVRRGLPAISFAVAGHPPLRRVTVSVRDAPELVRRLRSGAPVAAHPSAPPP